MRKFWILLIAAVAPVGASALGLDADVAGAKTSKPVNVSGKTNVKGKKDVSGKASASLEIEADDYYFQPTFVKVSPGEKVAVELKNDGKMTHTFTSATLRVDQEVAPGNTRKLTVTVPSTPGAFQFHCSIHQSLGMQGAFYTKAGVSAK